ncbi:MAG: DUF3040 domain-containing protein [Actinomycetota bacterium]|nr:DUF3040 domain-containing protein [Actinomycetota bacterium]MDA2980319.1 DUF3040 domain-containing protein [Actinomycetota bacterium]MDA3002624.1 DUF3040 domain-containing protein [Actinomycetota bacterium]
MPLSEHEQRLLEEMERNLYKNEADVMSTADFRRAPNYTAIAVGVLMGLVGLVTMVVGVSLDITLIGVIGFGVLFAGVMVAVAIPGAPSDGAQAPRPSAPRATSPAGSSSFMDRLNDRWERRERGEGL